MCIKSSKKCAAPAAGNLIGLAVSPIILAAFGWRSLFLIFGILGGPLLAFWLSVVPTSTPKGVHQSQAKIATHSIATEKDYKLLL